MTIPAEIKIYHILHMDRLPSIIADGFLWCDAEVIKRSSLGTAIGMNKIKERRRTQLRLTSHSNLFVGDCVPFYFCPRSVMLYLISRGNHPEISYQAGQEPIVHLVADLKRVIQWAETNNKRWAFTDANAGSRYFNDYADLSQLDCINWDAVQATYWQECREQKQAEFLIEHSFPWELVDQIGVHSAKIGRQVVEFLETKGHRPQVVIKPEWYY